MVIQIDTKWQYIASVTVALGAFSLGNAIGWSSPGHAIAKKSINSSGTDAMIIGGFMPAGAASSQLLQMWLLDSIGRKQTMLVYCPITLLGWLMMLFANSMILMNVARFICGFGAGSFCLAAPIFITEITQTSLRGPLGVAFYILLTLGIFVAYVLGALNNFYAMIVPLTIFPLLTFFGLLFLYESPIFLAKKGNQEKCEASLKFYRGKDSDIAKEMEMINGYAHLHQNESYLSLMGNIGLWKSFSMVLAMHVFQHLSGYSIIWFHIEKIFSNAGVTTPKGQAVLMAFLQILSSCISMYIVRIFTRKRILLISFSIMTLFMFVLSCYTLCYSVFPQETMKYSYIFVISIDLYIVGFSLGAGPLPWFMLCELIPLTVKGFAGSIIVCINWSLAFILVNTFVYTDYYVNDQTVYFIITVLCAIGVLFVQIMSVETANKSLLDIQCLLEGVRVDNRESVRFSL